MNKLFIFIIALTTNISAYASNGGVQTTFVPNMEIKELENKVYYNYLLEAYNTNKAYSDGLIKCAKSNKYYLPSHPSADAYGCYDVLAYLESIAITGTTTTYQGSISLPNGRLGVLGDGTHEGEFFADAKCHATFAGSRAARYEDMKYLIQTNNIKIGGSTAHVFGGVRDIESTTGLVVLSGEFSTDMSLSSSDATCDEYKSSSTTIKSRRIDTDATTDYINSGCGVTAQIICVSD